jgi:hypothetical protein
MVRFDRDWCNHDQARESWLRYQESTQTPGFVCKLKLARVVNRGGWLVRAKDYLLRWLRCAHTSSEDLKLVPFLTEKFFNYLDAI